MHLNFECKNNLCFQRFLTNLKIKILTIQSVVEVGYASKGFLFFDLILPSFTFLVTLQQFFQTTKITYGHHHRRCQIS